MDRHPRGGLDHLPEVMVGLLRQDMGNARARLRSARAVLADIAKALVAPPAEYEIGREMRERASELAMLACEILATVSRPTSGKAQPEDAPPTVEEFMPLGEIVARRSGVGTAAQHAEAMLATYSKSVGGER